ncbi:MAG: hypothetical protein IT346_04970 [Epsilonproteobacteria bacterium]|nr:hypothetical protein [Campylobacterota bacterium]
MKQVLCLCAITLLFSAIALQCSEKRKVTVSSSIFCFVYFDQEGVQGYGGLPRSPIEFDGLKRSGNFYYFPNQSKVTITVRRAVSASSTFDDRTAGQILATKEIPANDLIGKQIFVSFNPNNKVLIESKWEDAPYKTKIRAYKTTEDKADWTVLITDNKDTEITKKTFKQNTGNLYLQLNTYEINKSDDPNIVYNANKIKVFRGKDISGKPVFEPKIVKWNEVDPQKPELEISATGANFVAKDSEKASWINDKKIRAYKTVDDKVAWTVQITDNSGNKISQSTFKKNTDGVATAGLKLRLNPTEIFDGTEALKRYNANIVKVFTGKKVEPSALKFTKPITVSDLQAFPKGELQINANDAKIVEPGLDKK